MSSLIDLPPERSLPAARARARQSLVEQYAGAPARTSRRRRMVRYVAVAAAGSTLLFGGAAAAYVAYRPASVPVEDQTRCYAAASLDGGDSDFHGTTVGRAWSADGTRAGAAAIELCAALWQQGVLEAGANGVRPPAATPRRGQSRHSRRAHSTTGLPRSSPVTPGPALVSACRDWRNDPVLLALGSAPRFTVTADVGCHPGRQGGRPGQCSSSMPALRVNNPSGSGSWAGSVCTSTSSPSWSTVSPPIGSSAPRRLTKPSKPPRRGPGPRLPGRRRAIDARRRAGAAPAARAGTGPPATTAPAPRSASVRRTGGPPRAPARPARPRRSTAPGRSRRRWRPRPGRSLAPAPDCLADPAGEDRRRDGRPDERDQQAEGQGVFHRFTFVVGERTRYADTAS